jgi:hypothetical protein
MKLRKLSDLCLLVLLAAAGSVLRSPVGHQAGAGTSLVTPAKTPVIHCDTACDTTWWNA